MSEIVFLLGILFLYGIVRLLNLSDPSSSPQVFVKDRSAAFVRTFLASCPILLEPYVPPLLWGKSGHLQTVAYAKLGRQHLSLPRGVRHKTTLPDGATSSFDVFEPVKPHPSGGDYSLVVCPGLANSSEAAYIQTMVDNAQKHGFRVAVLNHMGALKNEPLTAPRIFTYGDTEEFSVTTERMQQLYPQSGLLAVGFSMGANIVVKYLGESAKHQQNFLCGISVCQGYDVNTAMPLLTSWGGLGRGYLYAMTANMKGLLTRHQHQLFGPEAQRRYGQVDQEQVLASSTLLDLDACFTCKRAGFADVSQFYTWCSSANYINNITVPMIILNAEDDPLVPLPLLAFPRKYAESHDNCVFVVTKHGGHLGFFEGQYLWSKPVTWLDRAMVEFANAVVAADWQERKKAYRSSWPSPSKSGAATESGVGDTLWQRTVSRPPGSSGLSGEGASSCMHGASVTMQD